MSVTLPINFNALRLALVDELQLATGLLAIMAEPEVQAAPRPKRPYFTLKMINPSLKVGDDSSSSLGGTVVNRGGQREMVVSYSCFACTHEDAYNFMALWQSWHELITAQTRLRAAGIAVWKSDGVRDLSLLLETGFEGRSQLDVHYGIASNLTEDTGAIETVTISGEAENPNGSNISLTNTFSLPH